ncbi:MAG: polyprenyl synthetase family protein [Actinomycetota bacterium]
MDFDGIPGLTTAINASLAQFFQQESEHLIKIGSELEPVADALGHFLLDSGKRVRPLFAAIGHLGTGAELTPEIIRAVSSLELVHVCALIHDDVMDASDTRRGAPAIHKQFEALHIKEELHGSAKQFGIASAILIGDLALIWAAKMLHESGAPSEHILRSLPIYDEMRIELTAGQYLDTYEQALASESVERSLKVARYKSGKYSIERPLQFGASLAPQFSQSIIDIYSKYGIPLGEAFQLRDDIIGVFGDPTITGKPTGDDLREGKRTVLVATTLSRSNSAQREIFLQNFGQPSLDLIKINQMREIIIETGALQELEALIGKLTSEARAVLTHGGITPQAASLLDEMATAATIRTS